MLRNPLVTSENEYFVSTAQKGRAHRVGQWWVLLAPVLGRRRKSPAAIHILKVKSHSNKWFPQSGQGISQSGCSRGTNLPADWRPKGPKHTSTLSVPLRKLQESRVLARVVQTVTLDMAEHCPNKSIWVVSRRGPPQAPRTGGVHETVCACANVLQVCVNKHPRFRLPTARTQ